MKRIISFIISTLITIHAFSQGEEVGTLTSNPELRKENAPLPTLKSTITTIDSSIIYTTDTLNTPFFDDFNKNHFQQYTKKYSGAGVTSIKKYKLLDEVSLSPLPATQKFSSQTTYRRIFNTATSTSSDVSLGATSYKIGDLSAYPVVYTSTLLFPPYTIYDTIGTAIPNPADTIWILNPPITQDSATQFFNTINDPTSFWLDSYAYQNYRYAIEPRSLGVATFDGLNEHGYPYAIGSTMTNYADVLTSKPINMAPLSAGDSVYFSFLYQTGGFGDAPEIGDSLILEFYANDFNKWIHVWSTNGAPTNGFNVGHVRISNPIYFKKGFQFRFKNYGALSGSLDHFHIDYVHLRALSGKQDTLFKDFAFVYPIGSLLKTYTSVPWDHFKNNPSGKMNDATKIVVHNGSNLTENNQNGQVKISYNNTTEGTFLMNAQTLSGGNINYAPRTTFTSLHNFSTGYTFDPTKPGNTQTFDVLATASAPFPNFAENDSTKNTQRFFNYYSYDDASAEAAYGPTGAQARLAVKYTAYEADSLIGLNMYFVPSVTDVSNKLFLITIWDDNNGKPGTVLYQDDAFSPRQPKISDRNQFVNYYFKDTMKVAVGKTFYVGWRQYDADRLNIGLDRNLDNSTKTYYSVDGGVSWNQSGISGSVMIRPIVSTTSDSSLGIQEINKENTATLYPNPTTNTVTIEMENGTYEGVEVYTIQGKQLIDTKEKTVDLQNEPAGIYFFHVKGNQQMYKIIKN
jgi:hypothetical protein